MSLLGHIHGEYVHTRRVRVLRDCLADLLPPDARVLDVGCGDGLLARLIMDRRSDIQISGIDVLVRSGTRISVSAFDGSTIPFPDKSFDVVMFIDVLHHTPDPMVLLREAARVSSKAILIKDHPMNGLFARPRLRVMDWVSNARHGVTLPYNYWPQERWDEAFATLNIRVSAWKRDLRLYPAWANPIFGGSLHFVARLDLASNGAKRLIPCESPVGGCDVDVDPWEAAYLQFEAPRQEIHKFIKRLKKMGAAQWSRDAEVVELFCGRGNGLRALSELGFSKVEGVDLSASLLAEYEGPGKCQVGDCRNLPYTDQSKDIVVIQGGLHHLQQLPGDLDQTLREVDRILREDGLVLIVEPWLTPFLSLTHAVCRNSVARRLSKKIEALATMIYYERETYEQWLRQPKVVLALLEQYFQVEKRSVAWGKLMFLGKKKNRQRQLI